MKKILFLILSAMLLAGPATAAAPLDLTIPAIQKEKKEKKVVTVTYKVSMHCKNCAAKITDNISFMKGVEDLKVSLEKKTVTVSYNPAKTDEATLVKAIEKLGYSVEKVQ